MYLSLDGSATVYVNSSSSERRLALPSASEAMSATPPASRRSWSVNDASGSARDQPGRRNPSGSQRSGATSTSLGVGVNRYSAGTSATTSRGSANGSVTDQEEPLGHLGADQRDAGDVRPAGPDADRALQAEGAVSSSRR